MESSLEAMRKQGATVVDVRLPKWLLDAKGEYYNAIRYPEFVVQIADYLKTLGPKYPKNITDLIDRARQRQRAAARRRQPESRPLVADGARIDQRHADRLSIHRRSAITRCRSCARSSTASSRPNNLDAIVYPTASRRPQRIDAPPEPPGGAASSGSNLANLSGFPDLIVPAGFSTEDLPIGISFLGPAFSESRLLAIGYAFEQATKARRLPVHTPLRAGDSIAVP